MQKINNIPIFGDPIDEGALSQIITCAKTADRVALMADHHKGYSVPIGGVVAYKDKISPSAVGYDIACGNKAVLLDIPAKDVKARISDIMDDVWNNISFGVGRKNKTKVEHPVFESEHWKLSPAKNLREMAINQLGTVGSGNHYVDILEDEKGRTWIGVHFGSRGLGHKITTWVLEKANAKDGMDVEPLVLDVDSYLGSTYIALMNLAGQYAYAGRDWVCEEVARLIGGKILEQVHNHHNFAWKELHDGEVLWVVRKGATPAFPGQKGFVGGSMGEMCVILEGVYSEMSSDTLCSTVHGAGRVMSRTDAKGKIHRKSGKVLKEGRVTRHMMLDWLKKARVELRGAGTDESPHCYKRLNEVLSHHSSTIKILHTLTPIGVAMAGEREFDPYKD